MYLYTKGKQSRETELEKYLSLMIVRTIWDMSHIFKQHTFFKVVTP